MKTKIIWAICIFASLIYIVGCGQQQKEEKLQESKIRGISLSDLAKDSINVTLWAESKESFESIIGDTLSCLGIHSVSFAMDMKEMLGAFEFSWVDVKQLMRLQRNERDFFDTDMFRDKTKSDFVVIGTYNTSDPWILRFNGYLYAYTYFQSKTTNKPKL